MQVCSKGEIAALYMPNSSIEVARAYLSSWIRNKKDLREELEAAGYTSNSKLLTPKQIKIIFDHLGEP